MLPSPTHIPSASNIRIPQYTRNGAHAAACAGPPRGYFHEYGNSWFNNRDNDDAYNMFRSYNNEYYRGDDADDEFDDGGDVEI